MPLFKKAAAFTDIHFGKSGNSEIHNQDCIRYIDWFCAQVEKEGCDTILFLGDWFDNRVYIRSDTKEYSRQAIRKLHELNLPIYWIVGNHDMFFKDNRTINWISELEEYDNITVINELVEIDDVLFCPWLVGDEFVIPPAKDVKYVFGHFEFPTFLVNEMIEMKDYGRGILADHFDSEALSHVFAGHFHKRQTQINTNDIPITYIGNAFPHNFNDANDTERGMMVLEWDQSPKYLNWQDAPTYIRVTTSELLQAIDAGEDLGDIFNEHCTVECLNDGGIEEGKGLSLDEAMKLKEDVSPYIRNVSFDQYHTDLDVSDETNLAGIKTTEQMVVEHLTQLDVEGTNFEPDLMIELWNGSAT